MLFHQDFDSWKQMILLPITTYFLIKQIVGLQFTTKVTYLQPCEYYPSKDILLKHMLINCVLHMDGQYITTIDIWCLNYRNMWIWIATSSINERGHEECGTYSYNLD
jgi:hypothetical protein